MAKRITFKTAYGSACIPLKAFVAVEVVGHILTVAVASAIGYAFGHPVIGALVGVGIGVVGEVVEYVFVKKLMQSGKLSISVR
jgi:membrane protein DedA with SNARE-associated domain